MGIPLQDFSSSWEGQDFLSSRGTDLPPPEKETVAGEGGKDSPPHSQEFLLRIFLLVMGMGPGLPVPPFPGLPLKVECQFGRMGCGVGLWGGAVVVRRKEEAD